MLKHHFSSIRDDWDQHLSYAGFAIANADHKSTGSPPFMLNDDFNPAYLLALLTSH